jgi:hypothetical protein
MAVRGRRASFIRMSDVAFWERGRRSEFLPLPALRGERVGVRGCLRGH